MTIFYTRYNAPSGPDVPGDSFAERGRTRAEFKDECDINRIMARYLKSGVWPESVGVAKYGDFSDIGDYQEALSRVDMAAAQFAGLPAKVRDKFGNSPAAFLAALPTMSLDEAAEIGILSDEVMKRRAAASPPAVAPVVAPVTPVAGK